VEACQNGGSHVEERCFSWDEHSSHAAQMITSIFIPVDIKRCFNQMHTELCYVRSLFLRLGLEVRILAVSSKVEDCIQ